MSAEKAVPSPSTTCPVAVGARSEEVVLPNGHVIPSVVAIVAVQNEGHDEVYLFGSSSY